MKFSFLLFVSCFFFTSISFAQSDGGVKYFKKNNKEVSSRDSAYYLRKIVYDDNAIANLYEYYLDETLKKKGTVILDSTGAQFIFVDTVYEYYSNGINQAITFYNEKGKRISDQTFYKNGQLKYERIFSVKKTEQNIGESISGNSITDYLDQIITYCDSLGNIQVKDGNGVAKEIFGLDDETGLYKNGFRDGEWQGSFLKSKASFTEQYEDGILQSGVSIDSTGITYTYKSLHEYPVYAQGGPNQFARMVASQYRFPVKAIDAGVTGVVLVEFVVSKEGVIKNEAVVKDVGYGTGAEALRVITQLRSKLKFVPGKYRGLPAETKYRFPISLNLQ